MKSRRRPSKGAVAALSIIFLLALAADAQATLIIQSSNCVLDCQGQTITPSNYNYQTDCTVETDVSEGDGIYLTQKTNVVIQNCDISGFDVQIAFGGTNITIRNNTLHNAHYYYGIQGGGTDFSIYNNTVHSNSYGGIIVGGSGIIHNNVIYGNGQYGLSVYAEGNLSIFNNTVFGNPGSGIVVSSTNILGVPRNGSSFVFDNIVFGNNRSGISLSRSNHTVIYDNVIYSNNMSGVRLYRSVNNSVYNNTIFNNSAYGVYLEYSSQFNSIYWNNVSNNNRGVEFYSYSSNNSFYDNVVCGNSDRDVVTEGTSSTTGFDNVCGSVLQYWDEGLSSGCRHLCGGDYFDSDGIPGSGVVNRVFNLSTIDNRTNDPVSGVSVTVFYSNRTIYTSLVSDGNGLAQFTPTQATTYIVNLSKGRYHSLEKSVDMVSLGPVILNVSVSSVSNSSAVVSWVTDTISSGQVDYGLNESYGSTASNGSLSTVHSVLLSSLTPGATHFYRVTAVDNFSLSDSASGNFTTDLTCWSFDNYTQGSPSLVSMSCGNFSFVVSVSSDVSDAVIYVTEKYSSPVSAEISDPHYGKYYSLELSSGLESNLDYVETRWAYSASELSGLGLTESLLGFYNYNDSLDWYRVNGSLDWVYGSGVNDSIVWFNSTRLTGLYGIGSSVSRRNISMYSGWNLVSIPLAPLS